MATTARHQISGRTPGGERIPGPGGTMTYDYGHRPERYSAASLAPAAIRTTADVVGQTAKLERELNEARRTREELEERLTAVEASFAQLRRLQEQVDARAEEQAEFAERRQSGFDPLAGVAVNTPQFQAGFDRFARENGVNPNDHQALNNSIERYAREGRQPVRGARPATQDRQHEPSRELTPKQVSSSFFTRRTSARTAPKGRQPSSAPPVT